MSGYKVTSECNALDPTGNVEARLKVDDIVYGDVRGDRIYFSKIYHDGALRWNLGITCSAPISRMIPTNEPEPGTPPPPVGPILKHIIKIYDQGQIQIDDGPIVP